VTASTGRSRRVPRRLIAVATVGTVAVAVAVIGVTDALAASSGAITGLGGKCVDVAGANSANGTAVQLYDCNGTNAQNWTVGNSDNSIQALGKCMDVTAAGTANGTKVQLYDCNGTNAQKWTASNGQLINTGSGKCLDATNNSSANGNQLQIWTCTGAANQKWTLPTGTPGGLNPSVAPGGNFDLSVWELQLPTGSPGAPTTILPAQLEGPNGFQDSYFYTDSTDGAMTFWDPENGVTTPNSNFSRSELREMTSSGAAANWFAPGNHRLSATLRVTQVPNHVCVGQIHLGSGGSTKPLLELFYYSNGNIQIGIEQTPAGGNEILYQVANVPLGTRWSYTIGLSGSTISLAVNGGAARTWQASSTFNGYGMYFKAGDYDQTSGSSSSVGARVAFYALNISHS
jgi:Alginate lyase/Ricin-type beta-trefoil lectin domain